MVDDGKSSTDLIDAVIGIMYIFFVFIIIALAISMKENWYGKKPSTKPPDLLPADYFNVIEPWGETTFITGNDVNLLGIDLSVCTWFTYQNLLNITKVPSVQNAIIDFENGFSHLSPTQSCIDSDQVVFKRAKRTCDGKGIAECIGIDGLSYNKNSSIVYNYPCTETIPLCSGSIGSLSFNFFENNQGRFSLIDAKTRVMTIETMFVSSATLAKLDSTPENQFYTRQGQLFTTSDVYNELGNEQYYPIITYQAKQTNNFKQTIGLRRYNYLEERYIASETGPYGEIIFRPGNLYLDVEINNTSDQIDGFSVNSIVGIVPELYRDQTKIRKMYKANTVIDTTCTGYIIAGNAYISIYRRGKEPVNVGDILTILADDNTTKSLSITIATVFDFSIFFVFKNGGTPRKWLLIPPLDIGGGKIIPRRDRSSYMRVFNSPPFSEPLYDLAKTRPSQGVQRGSNDDLTNAYNGRNPLNSFSDGLYKDKITVNTGTKALIRTIVDSRPQFDSDIYPTLREGDIVAWWEILETSQGAKGSSMGRTSKALVSPIKYATGDDTFNLGTYQNDHTENYLISIGDRAGQVDQTSSTFFTIQPFLGWKREETKNSKRWKAMLSMILTNGSPNLIPGNRYIDGSIVWGLVNPQTQIVVYSPQYFTRASVSGGGIIDFVPTDASASQKYKQEQNGLLFQVIFFGYELESDNADAIAVIENYTGSISGLDVVGKGTEGKVIVHFVNGNLNGITLQSPGKRYITGGNVSITIPVTPDFIDSPVTITNLLSDAENIRYTYVAIPQDQESNSYFTVTENDTKKITKNGFTLIKNSIEIVDGQLKLLSSPKTSIINKGSGYTISDDLDKNIVYIDQIDQFGNSPITERIPSSFYSFNITELDSEVIPIKTKSLFPQNIQINYPNFVEYNFYIDTDDDRTYGKSPQQIGYIDDPEINEYISIGGESEFKNYLFRSAEQPFNNIVGINTLQFERLNYTDSTTVPSIQSRDNLVLGKFIPYTNYYSDNLDYEGDILYNYNYVQYIPNGISNIYSRELDVDDLPTF